MVLVEGSLGTCEQRAHACLVHDVRHDLDLVPKVRLASLRQHLQRVLGAAKDAILAGNEEQEPANPTAQTSYSESAAVVESDAEIRGW